MSTPTITRRSTHRGRDFLAVAGTDAATDAGRLQGLEVKGPRVTGSQSAASVHAHFGRDDVRSLYASNRDATTARDDRAPGGVRTIPRLTGYRNPGGHRVPVDSLDGAVGAFAAGDADLFDLMAHELCDWIARTAPPTDEVHGLTGRQRLVTLQIPMLTQLVAAGAVDSDRLPDELITPADPSARVLARYGNPRELVDRMIGKSTRKARRTALGMWVEQDGTLGWAKPWLAGLTQPLDPVRTDRLLQPLAQRTGPSGSGSPYAVRTLRELVGRMPAVAAERFLTDLYASDLPFAIITEIAPVVSCAGRRSRLQDLREQAAISAASGPLPELHGLAVGPNLRLRVLHAGTPDSLWALGVEMSNCLVTHGPAGERLAGHVAVVAVDVDGRPQDAIEIDLRNRRVVQWHSRANRRPKTVDVVRPALIANGIDVGDISDGRATHLDTDP